MRNDKTKQTNKQRENSEKEQMKMERKVVKSERIQIPLIHYLSNCFILERSENIEVTEREREREGESVN